LEEAAMAHEVDLVIRGGLIADGSGGEPFIGDIAIANGIIAAVGSNLAVRWPGRDRRRRTAS
jgi:N-acyl-D-aspartate/D-glutamate deacylase